MTMTMQPVVPDATRGVPWPEAAALAVVLFTFVFVAVTFTSSGPQHADAVMDAEPSINMVLGRGAVSFAHSQSTPGSIHALVTPLYTALLAAWLAVWGIGCRAVMSFNAVAVAAAAGCVWLFLARTALVRSAPLRLLAVASLPLLAPVAVVYSNNRYDSIGMLGLAAACATLTCERRPLRLALLAGCGILVGTGGFHVIIGGAVLACLALAARGRGSLMEFLAFGVGTAVGLAITLGVVVGTGAMESLRGALNHNQTGVRRTPSLRNLAWCLVSPLRGGQRTGILDADLLPLAAMACAVIGTALSRRPLGLRSAAVFGAACGICVPLALSMAGRYSGTYVWLAVVPVFIGVIIAIDRDLEPGRWRWAAIALLAATVAAGFPARAAVAAAEWRAWDRAPVESFIQSHMEPDDVVYTTFTGYYPVKQRARLGFFGSAFRSMTAEQRAAVTLMVIGGKENGTALYEPTAEEAMASFGGAWDEVGDLVVPRGAIRMSLPLRPKSDCTYHVTVYRRRAASAVADP
jgi:hypothetical protein